MAETGSKLKVFSALAAGLVTFGLAAIIVRLVPEYSAYQISTIRTVLAAVFLAPVFFLRKKDAPGAVPITRSDHKWMALAGIMMGLHFMSWTVSLYYTSVASASVLVTTHPIILILAERLWFKIKFAATVWTGVIIAFSGSLLLGFTDSGFSETFANPALGNGLAFTSAFLFVVYFLIGRRVRQRHNLLEYTFPVYFWAALTSVVILVLVEGFTFPFEKRILLAGLGLAIGPQLIGHGAINYAVRYVSPTLLSTLILAEPLLASVMALIVFNELPGVYSIAAMLIILTGISLTWKKKRKTPNIISP